MDQFIGGGSIGNNGIYGAGIISSINSEATGSFMLGIAADGALYFYNFTRSRFKTDTTPCATLSTWFHAGIVWNGSTSTIYVDGNAVTSSVSGSLASGWGSGTQIGALWGGGSTGYKFDGLIDEAGIWGKALSTGEISELYNAGLGLPYN